MRSCILHLAPIAFSSLSLPSLAGTVHFDPPSANIMPGTPSVSFEVSVSWETLPTIDAVHVFTMGDYGANLTFEFASSFAEEPTLSFLESEDFGCCGFAGCQCESVGFSGYRFPPASGWTSPLLIGTLTVDTSGLLLGEQIEISVDPEISLVANGVNHEALSGLTTITVVPEPGTMMCAIISAIALVRTRSFKKMAHIANGQ